MNQSAEVLLKLMRIALGNEKDFSLPNVVNWEEVFDLAVKQGVPNICYDGVQTIMNANPSVEIGLNKTEWEPLRYKWLGYGMCADVNYSKHERVISILSSICEQNGFKMFLLKGYGLSLYYPVPSHRLSGDIDIYNMSDANKCEPQTLDIVFAETLGVKALKARIAHHSHFSLHGVSIENHYEFGNTYYGSESSKRFEKLLNSLLKIDYKSIYINSQRVYIPSATFNALFLISHLARHFCSERITLKQMCDWMMFLSAEHTNVNWNIVEKAYADAGLLSFVHVVNGLLIEYLGMDESLCPTIQRNSILEEKLSEDIFSIGQCNTFGSRVFRYPKQKWKYKLLKRHWFNAFVNSVVLHCFNREDMKECQIESKEVVYGN